MTAIRIILNLIGISGHLAFWFVFIVMFSMGALTSTDGGGK